MFFNAFEILDIILMTFILGFLFHDVFRKPVEADDDVLDHYRNKSYGPLGIEWHDFWWSVAIVAPTILIHELGHKFTALGFGLGAVFHGACSTDYLVHGGLGGFFNFYCDLTVITIILKLVGFGFLFFVPAFVAVGQGGSHLQYAIISFAGPFVHLVFWLTAAYLLKNKKRVRRMSKKHQLYLFFFKQINMFLFILNMIPIPGFDGFSVFYHLFKAFF
jgi:Zn-dependent protease